MSKNLSRNLPLHLRAARFLRGKLGALRKTEIYFSQYGPKDSRYYSLFLATLPPLTFLRGLLQDTPLDGKYVVIYLGKDSVLTEETLKTIGLSYQPIEQPDKAFFLLKLDNTQWKDFCMATEGATNWWILTAKGVAPMENWPLSDVALVALQKQLKALGILSGPAGCRSPSTDLKGEILVNYFEDPSFHGFSVRDFAVLIQAMFETGLSRLYPCPQGMKPFEHLDYIRQLQIEFGSRTSKNQSFLLTGGIFPTITRRDWPEVKRLRTQWNGEEWTPLISVTVTSLSDLYEIVRPYIIPALLVPVAILILPLTAVLWLLRSVRNWLRRKFILKDHPKE